MFEQFVVNYGYWAIVVGTFLEGETILVVGGFAAQRGYLTLAGVMAAAFMGSLFGDLCWFSVGRRYGDSLVRRTRWSARIDHALKLLGRYNKWFVTSFRFLYGIRTVAPFVIGMSPIRTRTFVWLNALGAVSWAVTVGGAGYLLGETAEGVLGSLKKYETMILIAILFVGGIVWTAHRLRRRRKEKKVEERAS